jgi:hypothetical protein
MAPSLVSGGLADFTAPFTISYSILHLEIVQAHRKIKCFLVQMKCGIFAVECSGIFRK